MKKVRVGLVGLGPLGKVHAENLMYRIPNAQLTAVCTAGDEPLPYKFRIKFFCVLHR